MQQLEFTNLGGNAVNRCDMKLKRDIFTIELRKKRIEDDIRFLRTKCIEKTSLQRSEAKVDYYLAQFADLIKKINISAFFSSSNPKNEIISLCKQFYELLSSLNGQERSELINIVLEKSNISVFLHMSEKGTNFGPIIFEYLAKIFQELCGAKWDYELMNHHSSIMEQFVSLLSNTNPVVEYHVS